jgi:hypothetical protein
MVTIVEASRCPICSWQGKLRHTRKVKGDDGRDWDLATYYCVNEDGCRWGKASSGWLVQSDEQGNVYERDKGPRGMDKTFDHRTITPDRLSRGQRIIEDLKGKDLRPGENESGPDSAA